MNGYNLRCSWRYSDDEQRENCLTPWHHTVYTFRDRQRAIEHVYDEIEEVVCDVVDDILEDGDAHQDWYDIVENGKFTDFYRCPQLLDHIIKVCLGGDDIPNVFEYELSEIVFKDDMDDYAEVGDEVVDEVVDDSDLYD